ncbi:beta galactosidase jelly roll domain-containing protein [Thermophagus sp. OGC60D27]|uniref:beta galactosidase jelly roll domain-containing protein n=1 Tax=Thermophagus sp. OGC60D27 TaxID=3458415 RepID=UPI004037FBEE
MKSILIIRLGLFLFLLHPMAFANIHPVVSLNGYWKFNIGDHISWAEKGFDDSDWDQIKAPDSWENQGYVGYNGYAWYRKSITIPGDAQQMQLYLSLDRIDDVNEVYFNGTRIGQTGGFPPKFETAYNIQVVYPIPSHLIQYDGNNTIAIRVYDDGEEGGLVGTELKLGYDENTQLLALNLSGNWKFSFYYTLSCLKPDFNDSEWDDILVPATWESQGYNNYDGQACYRKTFTLDNTLKDRALYFIGGKIDDKDQVFINGKLIGSTEKMYKTALGNSFWGDWQIRRAYPIPEGLLNYSGKNTVVVLVDDHGGMGGIFEGPVGLMTEEQYQQYEDKYDTEVWFPFKKFVKSLFPD